MASACLIKTLNVHNELGECILWNSTSQSVWWTDIHNALLYQYFPESDILQKYALPERLCSFGFIKNSEKLICAFASGFAYYNPNNAELEWLYRPEQNYQGTRFNDGRVDRQGRFWSGTITEGIDGEFGNAFNDKGDACKASLYWIGRDGHGKVLEDVSIANSLCWNQDASKMYFTDSPTQTIQCFEFDANKPALNSANVFSKCEGDSAPDGSCIDAEDHLWNAEWGGSRVVRYSPSGEVVFSIDLPVTQVTCVCFGGTDLNLVFITTARENLSEADLATQPEAGNVFIFETDFKGLPESLYLP